LRPVDDWFILPAVAFWHLAFHAVPILPNKDCGGLWLLTRGSSTSCWEIRRRLRRRVPRRHGRQGAQAGEARLREVVTGGGFSQFRRAAETPFNIVYEAKP
jgi:hypothetical protein